MATDVGGILGRHGHDPSRLLQILREVMEAQGALLPRDITTVAHGLKLPRARVEGVAGFYSFLGHGPRPRFRVLFSDNITDQMAGSVALRQRMLDAFHLSLGETSRDGLLSVDVTSCTGMGDQGPAMLVNGQAVARLTPARIGAVSSLIRAGSPLSAWPENLLTVESHVFRRDLLLNLTMPPGAAVA